MCHNNMDLHEILTVISLGCSGISKEKEFTFDRSSVEKRSRYPGNGSTTFDRPRKSVIRSSVAVRSNVGSCDI